MKTTSEKGDVALFKVMNDLSDKGYNIFLPVSSHLRFDLIAYKDNKCYRIQSKFLNNECRPIPAKVSWSNRTKKSVVLKYNDSDFDYYAVYYPEIDKVIYPSIKFKGACIRYTHPKVQSAKYYWYEDFLNFTDDAQKHSISEFGVAPQPLKERPRHPFRPDKERLVELVSSFPMRTIGRMLGVSDNAVRDWCEEDGIEFKKPYGYWQKRSNKIII